MSEENEINSGDIVCLNADKTKGDHQRFTVGSSPARGIYNIHWYSGGEVKTVAVSGKALHKLTS